MELTLSNEEHDLLLRILEQRQRQLLQEIAHTDSREFREGLHRDQRLLDSLAARLQMAAPGIRV